MSNSNSILALVFLLMIGIWPETHGQSRRWSRTERVHRSHRAIGHDANAVLEMLPSIIPGQILKNPLFREQLANALSGMDSPARQTEITKLLKDSFLNEPSVLDDNRDRFSKSFSDVQSELLESKPDESDEPKSAFKIVGESIKKTFANQFPNSHRDSEPSRQQNLDTGISKLSGVKQPRHPSEPNLLRDLFIHRPKTNSTDSPQPTDSELRNSNPILPPGPDSDSFIKSIPESGLSKALLDSFVEAVDSSSAELLGAFTDPNRLQDWSEWQKTITHGFNSWNRRLEHVSKSTFFKNNSGFKTGQFDLDTDLTKSTSIITFVVIGGLFLGGFLVWNHTQHKQAIPEFRLTMESVADVSRIKCPKSLVSVFDLLMQNQFGDGSKYWNHQTAFNELRTNSSVSMLDLDRLSDAYQKARYDASVQTEDQVFKHARKTLLAVQREAKGKI